MSVISNNNTEKMPELWAPDAPRPRHPRRAEEVARKRRVAHVVDAHPVEGREIELEQPARLGRRLGREGGAAARPVSAASSCDEKGRRVRRQPPILPRFSRGAGAVLCKAAVPAVRCT